MEIVDLVLRVARAAEAVGVKYYITGSVASSSWGEPRSTHDVDVVVDLPVEKVDWFCDQFEGGDFYFDRPAAKECIRRRQMFSIMAIEWGLKIDVIPPVDPALEKLRIARAVRSQVTATESADIASAEDSILSKMDFFRMGGSDKHIRDIRAIMASRRPVLDVKYIGLEAERLGLATIWEDLQAGRKPKSPADEA